HATAIRIPGFLVKMTSLIDDGVVTRRPASVVTTSPVSIPAESAGPPGTTPAISAPVAEPASAVDTWTPRKAVGPMWTTADDRPGATFCAIENAFATGIANADAADVPRSLKDGPDAAVTMPTTRPPASRSAPPESPGRTCAFVSINPVRRSD